MTYELEAISDNFWAVTSAGREVGTVVGDGPTHDTRFKAITASNAAMNPDTAPAYAYGRTLDEAARTLAN